MIEGEEKKNKEKEKETEMPAIFVINKNTLIDIIISSVAKTLILSSGPQGVYYYS